MNDTPLVLKSCMTVVALSPLLQYIVHSWSKLRGRGGGGKVRCHWVGATSQVRWTVNGGRTLRLRTIVVVIPLLLVIAGDVETNPGPGGIYIAIQLIKPVVCAASQFTVPWPNYYSKAVTPLQHDILSLRPSPSHLMSVGRQKLSISFLYYSCTIELISFSFKI